MSVQTKRLVAAALGLCLLVGGFWLGQASAQGPEPGSAGDPLVSKSYVDSLFATARTQWEQAIAAFRTHADGNYATRLEVAKITAGTATKEDIDERTIYRIVNVPAGQVAIGAASTEMVVRGGQATAVATESGGLLDVTGGWDVPHGDPVMPNHLLVVPRADGRGLYATTDLILLVKGDVTVQEPTAAP